MSNTGLPFRLPLRDIILAEVAHLRRLAEHYDGIDAEDYGKAADLIEALLAEVEKK